MIPSLLKKSILKEMYALKEKKCMLENHILMENN